MSDINSHIGLYDVPEYYGPAQSQGQYSAGTDVPVAPRLLDISHPPCRYTWFANQHKDGRLRLYDHVTESWRVEEEQSRKSHTAAGPTRKASERLHRPRSGVSGNLHNERVQAIVANPRRRRERAEARNRLQDAAIRVRLGTSHEIDDLAVLARLAGTVAPKTEKTAGELFLEYKRLAKKRARIRSDENYESRQNYQGPSNLEYSLPRQREQDPVQVKQDPEALQLRKQGPDPSQQRKQDFEISQRRNQTPEGPQQEEKTPEPSEPLEYRKALIQKAEIAIQRLKDVVKSGKVPQQQERVAAEKEVRPLAELVGRDPQLLFIELTPFLDKCY